MYTYLPYLWEVGPASAVACKDARAACPYSGGEVALAAQRERGRVAVNFLKTQNQSLNTVADATELRRVNP